MLILNNHSLVCLGQGVGDCVLLLVTEGDVDLGDAKQPLQLQVVAALEHHVRFACMRGELPSMSFAIRVMGKTNSRFPRALTVASLAAHREATKSAMYSSPSCSLRCSIYLGCSTLVRKRCAYFLESML